MREARLIETRDVGLEEIDVGERLRFVTPAALDALEASVDQLGVVLDEIHIRQVRHKDNKLLLIAGGHRVALASRKGWKGIRAKIWDCTDDWAALVEIDDNLAHAELSPLDLARFLARRKAIYERLYPETKAETFKGNQHTGKLVADIVSFARSVAEKRDLSERHVRRLIAAGEALTDDMVADLNMAVMTTERTITLADLVALAKLDTHETREEAVASFCKGTDVPTLKKAITLQRQTEKSAQKDPVEEGFNALLTAWKRAPMAARRRFVSEESASLFRLLNDLDQGLAE